MNISKWKLIWKWMTGGLESVWEYALEIANEQLAKLPAGKLGRYGGLTEQAAAMLKTAAGALKDGRLDKAEVDALAAEGRALAAAWREESE